jgi:transcriptional regulator with GAF, ATPase, and Fis domain
MSKFFNKPVLTQVFSRRGLLILAGVVISIYSLAVLLYVQSIPDIGLKSIFSMEIKGNPRKGRDGFQPLEGDLVREVGNIKIEAWPALLSAPSQLRKVLSVAPQPSWARTIKNEDGEEVQVRVTLERNGEKIHTWRVLGNLPLEEFLPSIVWFFSHLLLFLVGAVVLWKRPTDTAAALFFLLCIVTVGGYMGGYHWLYIATQPVLILIFMICAVMVPVISLHFYLIFPRKKAWLENHPRAGLLAIYGPPLLFLAALMAMYIRLRIVVQGRLAPAEEVEKLLAILRITASCYLLVASLWYLASVASLVHSFLTVTESTERKQVQWIMFGALLALVPFSYSLYLALFDPAAFGAGAATWPMFAASVCLTVAFAISITRYRLMELDQLISSGVVYFLISFLAGLVYYAVFFIGTLLFQAQPKLSEALTVSTTALVLMLGLDLARSRLKKVLDRRYFREKSQLDKTLQQLGQAVQQLVDPPALAKRLLHASTELLGVARGAVYLRQGEPPTYQLAGSFGAPSPQSELPLDCPLLESLNTGKVVNARPWPGLPLLPAQKQLQQLGGEIAQPLAHEGNLLAFLLLGPKGSAYRQEDLDLLAAFAQITVLALESADGHRTIEVLNQDLQAKVEKISEQQRRILALQTQLRRQKSPESPSSEEKSPTLPGDDQPRIGPGGMVGSSPVVRQLLNLVRKVSATDAVVLIRGESGTGKELLARAVHETSARAGKAFVKVHCAALSTGLLESELFGHVKGAFTGAHKDKVGRFELANGGTLFLDEIGDISLETQTKLLRVLQEKKFERVGSSDPMSVDVRIIAATHQDLEHLIRQGKFREDLFYRLNVFPITVPPLRERAEDIAELSMHFMRLSCQRCHKEPVQIEDDVLTLLKGFSWPGNIRQLENVVERAVVIAEGPIITLADLPVDLLHELESGERQQAATAKTGNGNGFHPLLDRAERDRQERLLFQQALAAADGNKAEAARALGLARSTLLSRLKKLGLS